MKILIISEYFPQSGKVEIKGGVETRAFYFAKEIAQNHDVTVISSWEKGAKQVDKFDNINVIRCGPEREYSQLGSIGGRLSFIFDAYKTGLKIKPDLVEGYSFISYIPAMWISKKLKIPAVATYHDVWVGEWIKNVGFFAGILGEVMERYTLAGKGKKWAQFITNSGCTKGKLINYGVPAKKIDTVYSGVDLQKYRKVKVKKYKEPTVVFVGRLVKYKRIDTLLLAIAEVRKKIKNIRLKIIGSGPEAGSIRQQIKNLNLEPNVDFIGFVEKHEDVLKIIKKSHIFSLPSEVEGLGLVTIEAMACEVPFANSNIPPTVEATEGGKGGLLFKVGDYRELAQRIIKLIEDKKLYRKCVQQERKTAEKYDWKNLVRQAEKAYSKLA